MRALCWAILLIGSCGFAWADSKAHFTDWPDGTSPEAIGRRVTDRFLDSRQHMLWTEFDTLHYAEVATWYGALTFSKLVDDTALRDRLVARFDSFYAQNERLIPPINHVDHTVFGALPLELYMQTGRAKDRMLGLAFADGQWDRPTPEGLTNQTRFWIDDMYMITLVQAQATRATGAPQYIDRAAREMVAYLEKLQQPNGLFFHAPDAPFYWGRGNGWMAAGMTELLISLPEAHPDRPQILRGYRTMMKTLLGYQTKEGMWRQLIDHPSAWLESSSTGMFTFAFVTGVKQGWLDPDTYGPAARKAWLALTKYIDPNGDIHEVCVGTGTKNDLQYYLDRPRAVGDFHGQAPLLWSASALLRRVDR